ncbi:MAG: chromosome segregation protein SMC [Pseudomonadota bacterium]
MKFTRLRLTGFKSFVDRTDVPIDRGLTGIVGPNGCGKSNLVEALRWVMGESSYKSLRASAMDDVIFSGSGKRPARNSAEVALVVDNGDRVAPIALNDDETLEISRRIEREHGSSYRINGREARARDVQLLFADAATGAHSPALVRQGMIGELISAKPQARRRLLEDAAGISGLHSRRHEAELRLKGADANLTRIDDVIAEIGSQRDYLKKQARHAKRYREMSTEIQRLEALVLYLRWRAASADLEALSETVRSAIAKVAATTEDASRTERVRDDAAAVLPGLREADAAAAAALRRFVAERESLSQREAAVRARQAELTRRLDEISSDRDREEAAISGTNDSLTAIARDIASLEADLARDRETAPKLEAAAKETQAALTDAEARHSAAMRERAEITARRKQAERLISDQSTRLMRLEAQRADIASETQHLTQSGDHTAELAALSRDVESAKQQLQDAEAAAVAAEQDKSAAELSERAARRPLREAEQSLKELETEHRTLTRLLTRTAEDLFAPLIDLVSVAPGFEAALGAALGDELDFPADEGAPIHWSEVAHGDDPKLPNGVRALSDVVRAPAVLTRRLAQIGLVPQSEGARLRHELKPGQRLVSPEGDLWRWDGFVARADAQTAAAERLAQQNRVADLDVEIATAKETLARLTDEARSAETAARNAARAEQAARETVKHAARDLQKTQDARSASERQHGETIARLSALAEADLRVKQSIEESAAAKADAVRVLEGLGGDDALTTTIQDLSHEIAEARARFAEARAAAQSWQREQEIRQTQITALTSERERWQTRVAEANTQIATLAVRAAELEAERDQLTEEPARLQVARAGLAGQIDSAQNACREASDALSKGETSLAEAEKVSRDAERGLTEAREQRAAIEARFAAQEERRDDCATAITETLHCAPEQARIHAGLDDNTNVAPLPATETKLDRLRQDRDRLGAVNLRAEQELEEIEERYTSLYQEREDLDKAVRKLRQAISNLNAEGRERLMDAFGKVNEHFQHLFSKLFDGGKAELRLTESDDPLEAGLEIIARPPGKKPQTLTLLSGGEQALTAIALIFAVFLTNPAPICVLDEVDAPLDDANVTRFCALMDEMARITETRYLIITHNPITMSRMDRLFGVTMAERGVSQIVSVDLVAAAELKAAE